MSEPRIPQRIVFVCATYLPRVTGVAAAIHAWTPKLTALGARITVVAPEYPPCPYYPASGYPDGLEVVRLPSRPMPLIEGIQQPLPRGAAWDRLLAELRGEQALIHGQDVLLAGEIALRMGRRCRLPVVLHGHYPLGEGEKADWLPVEIGSVGRRGVNAVLRAAIERKARAVCRRAALVAVVSPYMENLFRSRRVAEPVVVPCGVEPPAQPPRIDVRKRHGIAANAPLFLFVGRLDPDKRIGDLLESAAYLRAREPRAQVLLVGGGPYLSRYAARAEAARLGDCVTFAGWVPHREVWAYYQQADLFLIASPHEGQGLVALEAQLAGLPVVGYRGGGISQTVTDGQTGVLTDPAPQALAAAALALWREPSRRHALAAAARRQAAAYAIDHVFPSLLAAYARAMNGRSACA